MAQLPPIDDDEKQRVRSLILSAFQGVPMPEYGEIVAEPGSGDVYGERRLQEELAGVTRENVPPSFFKRRWSLLSYLSAPAFQYYIPGLLLLALDENDPELAGIALYALTPSTSAMYIEETDDVFNEQTSLLTPEQEDAIIEFLGLFVDPDQPSHFGFYAGLAFRIGWDRDDMPERQPFAGFYHRMYHFTYPEPDDPKVAELVGAIHGAFAETPYPENDGFIMAGDPPVLEEIARYALEFQDLDWSTIHPSLLADNAAALNYFTSDGLRYFLPAYLIADLIDLGIPTAADPVFQLTTGFTDTAGDEPEQDQSQNIIPTGLAPSDSWRDTLQGLGSDQFQSDSFIFSAERMAAFSANERRAIVSYLEYQAEIDQERAGEIRAALARYWLPSLEEAQRE